ncbi:MAG: NADH-quinone oxidoreductase subunit J, partial [Pseudomonadota bacterium]
LVAMIGAIMLTFRERRGVKTQDVAAQVARRREDAVEVVSVPSGRGL